MQTVLDNPTSFVNPFQFEITFECLTELDEGKQSTTPFAQVWLVLRRFTDCAHSPHDFLDLEWKVLYVGSAHDAGKDQVLDEILVGPVPVGMSKFLLSADAPLVEHLPDTEVLGVTVVLVTCSYRSREFVRIGYYVNNEYVDPNAPPPAPMPMDNLEPTSPNNASGEESAVATAATPEQSSPSPPLPPPAPLSIRDLDVRLIQRHIMADKPRITKFPISWDNEEQPATVAAATLPLTTAVPPPSLSLSAESPFQKYDASLAEQPHPM
jgi:histone chaperone ASF1